MFAKYKKRSLDKFVYIIQRTKSIVNKQKRGAKDTLTICFTLRF